MKLYKISQSTNKYVDTYEGAIVAAEDEDDARIIHPSESYHEAGSSWNGKDTDTWVDVTAVKVEYIGEAKLGIRRGVVLAAFYGV